MVRRVMVGPRKEELDITPASPVVGYYVGEFEYWSGEESGYMQVGNRQLVIKPDENAKDIEVPAFVVVGVDSGRKLVEVKPATPDQRGALPVFERKGLLVVKKTALIKWLRAKGVPGQRIPARWQPQTNSFVGKWGQPAVNRSRADDNEDEPALTDATSAQDDKPRVVYEHDFRPTDLQGPTGTKLYRCTVCGYYTADPRNPLSKSKPCKPGLYANCYSTEGGVVKPVPAAFRSAFARMREESDTE